MFNETQTNDGRIEKLHLIEEQLTAQNGKLYVWGAAKTAQLITSLIKENSSLSPEAYVIDDVYFKEGTFLDRPKIKSSEFMSAVTEKDWVIIGFTGFEKAKKLMKELSSLVSSAYFSFPMSVNIQDSWIDRAFYRQHKERFENTRNVLSDDISKNIMDAFLKTCFTGSIEELEKLRSKGQYFNELTSSCRAGCFVDCGAYTGDSLETAFDFLGSRLERVIAFEPDPDNFDKLKEYMQKTGMAADNMKLLKMGSNDKAETLRFSASSDMISAVSENGEITIETDSIDNAAADMGEVSFIKMDVEGSELKSILGAADTIRKYHPILAISAYHKMEDLFELPEAIRKITDDSGYRYYLRYHGPDMTDMVLYAIPD